MCAVASSLVLVKHTKRATNISRFGKDIVEVESLVGFLKGIRSPGAAEAADTRSIAVELLSQLLLAVDSHTLLLCCALVQQLYVQGIKF